MEMILTGLKLYAGYVIGSFLIGAIILILYVSCILLFGKKRRS